MGDDGDANKNNDKPEKGEKQPSSEMEAPNRKRRKANKSSSAATPSASALSFDDDVTGGGGDDEWDIENGSVPPQPPPSLHASTSAIGGGGGRPQSQFQRADPCRDPPQSSGNSNSANTEVLRMLTAMKEEMAELRKVNRQQMSGLLAEQKKTASAVQKIAMTTKAKTPLTNAYELVAAFYRIIDSTGMGNGKQIITAMAEYIEGLHDKDIPMQATTRTLVAQIRDLVMNDSRDIEGKNLAAEFLAPIRSLKADSDKMSPEQPSNASASSSSSSAASASAPGRVVCYNCGQAGHYSTVCPNPKNDFKDFCTYCFNATGRKITSHTTANCRRKTGFATPVTPNPSTASAASAPPPQTAATAASAANPKSGCKSPARTHAHTYHAPPHDSRGPVTNRSATIDIETNLPPHERGRAQYKPQNSSSQQTISSTDPQNNDMICVQNTPFELSVKQPIKYQSGGTIDSSFFPHSTTPITARQSQSLWTDTKSKSPPPPLLHSQSQNPMHESMVTSKSMPATSVSVQSIKPIKQRLLRARIPIRTLAKRMKDHFHKLDADKSCVFCKKIGHTIQHCPSMPDIAATDELSDQQREWLQKLIDLPRIDVLIEYKNMDGERALIHATELSKRFNADNPWLLSTTARDSTRRSIGFWKAIGADATALAWIGAGAHMPVTREPHAFEFANHPSYHQHIDFVDKEMEKAITEGSFIPIHRNDVKIVNPISVEPNKAGTKLRMCVDARWHNAHLPKIVFRLENIDSHLAETVRRSDVMVTTDISRAYYSIPLRSEHSPYLVIKHRNKYFAPKVLPFGSSLAPFIFNKLTRNIIAFSRAVGIRTLGFYDDFLWSSIKRKGDNTANFAVALLTSLGFLLNDKVRLKPQHITDFLGFTIDTNLFRIHVTSKRIERAAAIIRKIKEEWERGMQSDVEELHSLAGQLISMSPAIPAARVWTRHMLQDVRNADRIGQLTIDIDPETVDEIRFWSTELHTQNGASITAKAARLFWQIDASESAIGAVSSNGEKACIPLPERAIGKSSTYRELLGVLLTLQLWTNQSHRRTIELQMDSFAGVRNICKGGGPISELNDLTKQIWEQTEHNGTTIRAVWIPREENSVADTLSKLWDLPLKLTDPCATVISQFMQRHNHTSKLVLAQFNNVKNELMLAEAENRDIYLVHPRWPSQSWWPLLTQHTIQQLSLGTYQSIIQLPHAHRFPHPRWEMLISLVSWSCSRQSFKDRACSVSQTDGRVDTRTYGFQNESKV